MTPLVSQLWPQFMADPAFASCFGQVIVEHARMLRQSQQVIFTLRSAAPLDKGLCARLLASLAPDYEGFELRINNLFGYATLDEAGLRELMEEMKPHDGCTTIELRRRFAAAAFALSAKYDAAISSWFAKQLNPEQKTDVIVTRPYLPVRELKYGVNPHQKPAGLYRHLNSDLPFEVVFGNPGYINLCDALNSWMLVKEARQALGVVAAASFKHVSPAGCAIAVPLTEVECKAYEVSDPNISGAALAYLRARNAHPMSSFGDFAAISDVVDESAAKFIASCISDGIIAAGYTPEALEILKKKKNGAFIILQGKPDFKMPEMEFRELHGAVLAQRHNDAVPSREQMTNVVTEAKEIPESAMNDMILGNICLKYTQSNSVCYVKDGQAIGVGAGQQSRIHCTRLAGQKADNWYLRQHPKVLGLQFVDNIRRPDRDNAIDIYTSDEYEDVLADGVWQNTFKVRPEVLTPEEKKAWIATQAGVTVGSDAFFPFGDNIERARRSGVTAIVQPGGSIRDQQVIDTCNKYGIAMAFCGIRLFHH